MKLKLERIYTCKKYTIGKFYINDEYFCDTIEDCDRGLTKCMSDSEIEKKKIYGETAIPIGVYDVTMKEKSPKFSNFSKYKWAKICNGYLPRLKNVPGFDGILIHVANKAEDILGCIGVGENKVKGQVINSTITFNKLIPILQEADKNNENIEIEISQKYNKKAV